VAQTAAHLVDNVIPRVPVRQWMQVCQARLPIFLRLPLPAQPKLTPPVLQVVHRAITRYLLGQAILVGQQILEVLTPFLLHLLDKRLAKATVSRHRDNLWALGGELIRCRYDDELAKKNVKDALRQLTQDDGGPLMWPRITEAQQDSLDATCRKLNRFLRESAAAQPTD